MLHRMRQADRLRGADSGALPAAHCRDGPRALLSRQGSYLVDHDATPVFLPPPGCPVRRNTLRSRMGLEHNS